MRQRPNFGTKKLVSRSPNFLQKFSTANLNEKNERLVLAMKKAHSIIKTDNFDFY